MFFVLLKMILIKVQSSTRKLKKDNSVITELIVVIKALRYYNENEFKKEVTIVHDCNEISMFATSYGKSRNNFMNNYIRELVKLYNLLNVRF